MKLFLVRATKYKAIRVAVLLTVAFAAAFASLRAAEKSDISVRLYDQRHMIAGDYSSICQDRNGFIWIGTDAGLIRFDGNHSDLYRNDDQKVGSITDNKILCLRCDGKGRVWVGTANGLNLYKESSDTFRSVVLPDAMLNGFISDICEMPDGTTLFLVAGIGFYAVDPDKSESHADTISARRCRFGFKDDHQISRAVNDGDDAVLFSTRSGDLWRLDASGRLQRLAGVGGNVTEICVESPATILFATQYEAYRLDKHTGKVTPLRISSGERIKIINLHFTGKTTYLSSANSGLWEIAPGSDRITRPLHFHSSSLNLNTTKLGCAFTDRSGNLWLGCCSKGVAVAPAGGGAIFHKSLTDILRNEGDAEVTCMQALGKEIAVGLNTGSILLLSSDGSVRKVRVAPGCMVTGMACSPDGRLIAGVAREGVWSVDLRTLNAKRLIKPLKSYPGVVVTVGRKDGVVIAAFGELGVVRYDPATGDEKWFYPVAGSNLLSCFYYSGIHPSADGKVWIGGYSGIACYDPSSDGLMPIDQTPFLKGVVHAICDYKDGLILGTDRGLIHYVYGEGVKRKFTVADGLPDNSVQTLQPDGAGGVWLGTKKGLAYLDGERISTYSGNPGLSKIDFGFSSRFGQSGRILMGQREGFTIFHPDSVAQGSFGAGVMVTGLYLNGKKLTADTMTGRKTAIEGDPSMPDMVNLAYKDNSLMITLSTMDFRDSSDLCFEWQLDGDYEAWHSSPVGESRIYLPPLDKGRHTLRIRGREHEMASDITELKLDVETPWYLSNMAYVGYFICILLMGGLVYKLFKTKREEELYEERIKYFMDISHELRSPVTLMLTPVDAMLKENHSPETNAQLLTVRRNAQRVLSLVDQLLDLRKIEKGKMRLVYTPTDIRAFVEELVGMFEPLAHEKGLSISFRCEDKTINGDVDRDNLDKILVNLISNAIKYTPKGGEVTVVLSRTESLTGTRSYRITVTDTGIGLDSKTMAHLFDRFYRNRERHGSGTSGFGIGLDLCMRLVALHKGEITAENRKDGQKGSVFTVTLPLRSIAPSGEADGDAPRRSLVIPAPALPPNSETVTAKNRSRFHILIVDDDEEIREYVRLNLGKTYHVETASCGEEALRKIGVRMPDLIITDVRMDGISGLELLGRVKNNVASQHVPVILFSSEGSPDLRTQGWRRGADGYLPKPFSIAELEGLVAGLLDNRSKLKGKFTETKESVDAIEAPKVKGVDRDLMERINRSISENLSDPAMNVDTLSESVGLSRSQLHRRMKELVGVSPSDYIRSVKIRKACEMLSRGDVDIAQVAYALGFSAQSHFSTVFKRQTGLTPSEYRADATNENVACDVSGSNGPKGQLADSQ